jgi:hypothetical protein
VGGPWLLCGVRSVVRMNGSSGSRSERPRLHGARHRWSRRRSSRSSVGRGWPARGFARCLSGSWALVAVLRARRPRRRPLLRAHETAGRRSSTPRTTR